ncbi:small membrane protein YkgR [Escherichia coli]
MEASRKDQISNLLIRAVIAIAVVEYIYLFARYF